MNIAKFIKNYSKPHIPRTVCIAHQRIVLAPHDRFPIRIPRNLLPLTNLSRTIRSQSGQKLNKQTIETIHIFEFTHLSGRNLTVTVTLSVGPSASKFATSSKKNCVGLLRADDDAGELWPSMEASRTSLDDEVVDDDGELTDLDEIDFFGPGVVDLDTMDWASIRGSGIKSERHWRPNEAHKRRHS